VQVALAVAAAGSVVVAMSHLDEAPPLPVPSNPYRDVSQCQDEPHSMALVDANGDDHPDIAILCGSELVVASGIDGGALWRVAFDRDLERYPGLGPFLIGGGGLTLAYGHSIESIDPATGDVRWTKRLGDSISFFEVEQGCVQVGRYGYEQQGFSAADGEPSTCRIPFRGRGDVEVWTERAEDFGQLVVFARDRQRVWSARCGPHICQATLTPAGVLVWNHADGESPIRFARIHDLYSGRIVRVLDIAAARWNFWSLPPYLIASHRPLADPSRPGKSVRRATRPVIEVFDATSLVTRWRSSPEGPPPTWQRAVIGVAGAPDYVEPEIPGEVRACMEDDELPLTPGRRGFDFGDLDYFQNCTAKPRRDLSARDQCLIRKLSSDCTEAADCLVTCIASPDGHRIGGECDHVCFRGRLPLSTRPPAADACDDLEL
jgi:hypothetical protein